jgi:UPF0271 protein
LDWVKSVIDLNCDMGESFGIYHYGRDQEMMPLISSANVACGFHGGDPRVMRETVLLAKQYGVRIGAHVGLPDRFGFGRRYIELSAAEMADYTLYQIGALDAFVRVQGLNVSHVKLHGAMYMMAAAQEELAEAFSKAVASYNPELEIYALPGSCMESVAAASGLRVRREYFADRPYDNKEVKMFGWSYEEIGTASDAAVRLAGMLRNSQLADFDTICVHSDTRNAPDIMRHVKEELDRLGYEVPGKSN